MKSIHALFVSFVLMATSLCAYAQNSDLSLNGIAAFEQLRKEYYIGALYLGWPGHDAESIANMPGKKRMELHITADQWPPLRFSQMWNQAITINNPSSFINAHALDILAFSSILKSDLVAGDQITIELTAGNTTVVTLNGITALRTKNSALFNMLLNAWIGPRPPSTEFKRDILKLPTDKATEALVARFKATQPNESRRKTIAGWGFKAEPEAETRNTPPPAEVPTTTVTATAAAATSAKTAEAAAKAETTAAAAAKPGAAAPATATTKAEPAAKGAAGTKTETATTAAAKPAAEPAKPKTAAVAPPKPDAAALAAKAAHDEKQNELDKAYYAVVRRQVIRKIEYPRRAVKENIEGLVMVRVKIDRSGHLSSFEIAQSADNVLDNEVERAVRKAAPFPKPADELEGSSFQYIVPVVFKLTQ